MKMHITISKINGGGSCMQSHETADAVDELKQKVHEQILHTALKTL